MPSRRDVIRQAEIHLESLRARIGAEKFQIAHRIATDRRLNLMRPGDFF